jgi:hypothetical protein
MLVISVVLAIVVMTAAGGYFTARPPEGSGRSGTPAEQAVSPEGHVDPSDVAGPHADDQARTAKPRG